jgi:hypothetical protein
VRHLRCDGSVVLRLWLLSSMLVMSGCGATYIKATIQENPLDNIAQQAKGLQWSVERVDDTTLHLRDSWPLYSIVSFGYTAAYADLFYDPSAQELDLKFYLRSFQLFWLYIPVYLDAEYGFFGGALKPTMRDELDDILRWSGATVKSRRAGSTSEPFPP